MAGAQKGSRAAYQPERMGRRVLFKTRRRHWPALIHKVRVQLQPLNELQVNISCLSYQQVILAALYLLLVDSRLRL